MLFRSLGIKVACRPNSAAMVRTTHLKVTVLSAAVRTLVSQKRPFITVDRLEAIASRYPTPFYLYDERGIRENARRVLEAFA